MQNLNVIFLELRKLLVRYNTGSLSGRKSITNSKTKLDKPSYHLYGKKELSIIKGRKPQLTYFAGIIKQKNFIGFYFMPVYSHPKELMPKNPELKKFLKGKSCFNVTHLSPSLLRGIRKMLDAGLKLYKKEDWV